MGQCMARPYRHSDCTMEHKGPIVASLMPVDALWVHALLLTPGVSNQDVSLERHWSHCAVWAWPLGTLSQSTLVPGVFLAPAHTNVASQVLQHLSWVLLAVSLQCHWPPGGKTAFIHLCRKFFAVSMELQVAEINSTGVLHPTMIHYGPHKVVICYLKCCWIFFKCSI